MRARDNPFSVQRVLKLRYRFPEGGWQELLLRLAELDYRAAIVGPEGSGKTTLLEDLGEVLAKQGFQIHHVALEAGQKCLTRAQEEMLHDMSANTLRLVDGADQLSSGAWGALRRTSRRSTAGLVITAHREGLLPTLWRTRTSVQLLRALIRDLTGGNPEALGRSSQKLFEWHAGNLRGALRELYDLCADR